MSVSLNSLDKTTSTQPSFSEQVKRNSGTVKILHARFRENFYRVGGYNPDEILSSAGKSQFALDLRRIEKVIARIGLLDGIKAFGLQLAVGEDVNLKYQVSRISPELFTTNDPEKVAKLIHSARQNLDARLVILYNKMVKWASLQPAINGSSAEQFYERVLLIRGALSSSKGADPTIPFLKCVIEERVAWLLKSIPTDSADFNSQLFSLLEKERALIFKQIPDMFYNTFLGAQNPKVQENLRNQNDLVKISREDVMDHIFFLQIKAVERLAPKVLARITPAALSQPYMTPDLQIELLRKI